MTEQQKQALVRQSVDTALSAIQPDPRLAQRIIQQEREEPAMQKKLSLGLVFMMLILLLTTAALAVVKGFGILDYLPQQADNRAYVENIMTLDQQWEGQYFSAAIHEAVFDGMKMTFTMSIKPKEKADPVYVIPRIRAEANGQVLDTWIMGGNGGFHEDGFWVPDIMPDFKYDYSGWAVDVALSDGQMGYAPSAEDIQWTIDFDVLHTDWPIGFTGEDEPAMDEESWTDEAYAAYERQFIQAYRNQQVLLNRAGMFGFWLQAVREQRDGEKYADYCQDVLTQEAFTLAECASFRFAASGQPVKTAKKPAAFTTPDGSFQVVVEAVHATVSQIGLSLRITSDAGNQTEPLSCPWDFIVMAEGARTAFESSSMGLQEDGSLRYTAHIMAEGDTDRLILLPVLDPFAKVTADTPDGVQQVALHRALMQKWLPMTPEQEQQAVMIELK